jgi:MFS family permease
MATQVSASDRVLIFIAAWLRSTATGLLGVILALYLAERGAGPFMIGLTIGLGLAGNACAMLAAGFFADRIGRRRYLILLSILAALGGLALAFGAAGAVLAIAAFLGMVNGMGRDRGPASTLDQVMLPATTADERRTAVLSWYHVIVDAGHAAGSLAALAPVYLRAGLGIDVLRSYQLTFGAYSALAVLAAMLYARLSPQVEVRPPSPASAGDEPGAMPSPPRHLRAVIRRFAMLSGLDSLGGGFLTTALVAYWFYRRFGVDEETLAPFFFAARVLNAVSYLAAARLARAIGLVNTMVFTHLPSSLILLFVPFAPSIGLAMGLFLLRELLVEMDVPTRQSYLLALVPPGHRTLAASMTALARQAAWAISPGIAGWAMGNLGLSAALLAGAGLKVVYDLTLFASFRRLKPPEETRARAPGAGGDPAPEPAGGTQSAGEVV